MGEGMNSKEVGYEKKDNVAIITINSPENMNALSKTVREALLSALDRAEQDMEVRVVILTGTGKVFIAGADLKDLPKKGDIQGTRDFLRTSIHMFRRFETLSKPIIAAVNGLALGGGFEVTLYCDIVTASEKAKFSFPEAGLGIIAAFGLLRLHQTVGRHKAKELLMTADMIDAEEARRLNLVNQVVPHDELIDKTMELAQKIVKNAPLSVEGIKTALNRELGGMDVNYLMDAIPIFFSTNDIGEGVGAFMEKRRPKFTGS